MTPCTLKLVDKRAFEYRKWTSVTASKYAPHNFIRDCAHLVGETVLVPAVLSRGDGRGPSRVPDVLPNCAAVGITDL